MLPFRTYCEMILTFEQIGGNNQVSAQVKIKFYNGNRDMYTVNRNLSCTMSKAGKKSMKTVEGSMVLKSRNGERTTVSTSKCISHLLPNSWVGDHVLPASSNTHES